MIRYLRRVKRFGNMNVYHILFKYGILLSWVFSFKNALMLNYCNWIKCFSVLRRR